MNKPKTIPEYIVWGREYLHIDFGDDKGENLYDINLTKAFNTVSEHKFIRDIDSKLAEWADAYERKTKSQLLMDNSTLSLLRKTYESAIDKSFRTNVLWNKNYPEPPDKGWVTPSNLFHYFNDGLRGSLVCKFIDGPSFLTDKLTTHANELGITNRWYSQAKDEGYYAYHFYGRFSVDLYDIHLQTYKSEVEVEVQLTTQLQEVLRNLTHHFYEQRRIRPEPDNLEWKWDYESNRFRSSYLSHTLHLLEAIIVQSRDINNKTDEVVSAEEKEHYE